MQTALKVGFVVFTDTSTVNSSLTTSKAVRFKAASKQEKHSKKKVQVAHWNFGSKMGERKLADFGGPEINV